MILSLSDALISPISPFQAQQVMTSLIRAHIEYLLQTVVEIGEKSGLNGGFYYDFMMIRNIVLLFGPRTGWPQTLTRRLRNLLSHF